jgi:CubicO group peptidase (beta-lactamase class C family)
MFIPPSPRPKTGLNGLILLLCITLCVGRASAQSTPVAPSSYHFSPVDQVLGAYQKPLDKDLTVLIYKDGKVIYKKEMGESKANIPVEVGSTSKWLTIALVMTLVDQGKLSLDEKVSTYLPIFKTYGKAYITVRQCLTHFTGLASPGFGNIKLGHYASLEEEVNDLVKREIKTNPGTEFAYSDAGYAIVGRVLEVITKKPFDRLIKETLFRSLSMQRSTFTSEHAVDPAEGALCTPAELLNFTAMILGKGVFNGKRIISEQSMAEMLKTAVPQTRIKSYPIGVDGYNCALGAWIQSTDAGGNANVIVAPSLTGSWAFVDFAGGYAAVILVTKSFNEPKKQAFVAIKDAMDSVFK